MRPEHLLQTQVGRFVRSAVTVPHFFECYDRSKDHTGTQHLWEANRHIKAGTPDTALVVGGCIYRIELKAPGNQPTTRQMEVMQLIRLAGGRVGWCTNVEDYGAQLEVWDVPLANNWRIQAQHYDALIAAKLAKAPTAKKGRAPSLKPTRARIARVNAAMMGFRVRGGVE